MLNDIADIDAGFTSTAKHHRGMAVSMAGSGQVAQGGGHLVLAVDETEPATVRQRHKVVGQVGGASALVRVGGIFVFAALHIVLSVGKGRL